MEIIEDIVIVGAGIAGLATALGLHRMGLKSLVLESSDSLRITGFAFLTWTNAWRALDALGIGSSLRQEHLPLQGKSWNMEIIEDIVIVGAGIAGLTTALGLHRTGLKSLVLESSDSLRITGFAFLTWTNAWRALDALGIGSSLRQEHLPLQGLVGGSTATGLSTAQISIKASAKCGDHEVRCVKRKLLLETLVKELPPDTIRFDSKVVSIEVTGNLKLVHLADGTILKTKVLIGCDGVNSVVGKWLGLQKPAFAGRWSVRGLTEFPDGHGFRPEFLQYFGDGFRSGFLPCDENTIYWFFTYSPSPENKGKEESASEMKEYVLSKLGNLPQEVASVVEKSKLDAVIASPLRFRWPWHLLWGDICKGNVCVAGDALHPMTPDLGQGACSALEDGVVLARCLGEALLEKTRGGAKEEEEYERMKKGMDKYARERRWRGIELITTAYVLGWIQQSDGKVINYLRDKWLSKRMAEMLLKKADFDCGKLYSPI
ncbi:monooxygenase 2-like isoform X3 [Tasmannia lanceolata]